MRASVGNKIRTKNQKGRYMDQKVGVVGTAGLEQYRR